MDDPADPIRPPQLILAFLIAAAAGFLFFLVRASRAQEDPRLAWLGGAFCVLFLPVFAWYRAAIHIEEDGLRREGFLSTTRLPYGDISSYGYRRVYDINGTILWLCILGRDDTRIEAAVSWIGRAAQEALVDAIRRRAPQAKKLDRVEPPADRTTLVVAASAVLVLLALIPLGVFMPLTLGDGRLLDIATGSGLILGLSLGAAMGRSLLPRSPVSLVCAGGLVLMAWMPAAAFAANFFLGHGAWRSPPLIVRAKKTFPSKDPRGQAAYAVAYEVDGAVKRHSPSRKAWETVWRDLPVGSPVPACVRPGGLGYPVLVAVGRACPQENVASPR